MIFRLSSTCGKTNQGRKSQATQAEGKKVPHWSPNLIVQQVPPFYSFYNSLPVSQLHRIYVHFQHGEIVALYPRKNDKASSPVL
jgi:hypothetical protein